MDTDLKRREFLTIAGSLLGGITLANLSELRVAAAETVKSSSPTAAAMGWQVGAAMYTFRRYSLYEALDMIAALGIQYVEPDFFLSLDKSRPKLKTNEDLTPEVRKEWKAKMADRGITMYSYYANLDADQDRARKIFDFCKEMGASTIVAEPPAAAFDMIDKLCDEYQINVAIHNHPEKPQSVYWKPENVLAVCKGRSKRIGACCDTGHWARSGLDVIECLKKLEGRILSFHLTELSQILSRSSGEI